eukprot:7386275-Prymnesium_polylepis.1
MSACADGCSRFFKRGAATSLDACICLCATHSAPRGLFLRCVAVTHGWAARAITDGGVLLNTGNLHDLMGALNNPNVDRMDFHYVPM